MFVNKLVCDKCGMEVSASDKYCKECGTARDSDYTIGKEISDEDRLFDLWKKSQPKPYNKDKVVSPSLDDLIRKSSRCKSCGKLLSPYSAHTCPGLVYKPIDIRWGGPDVKFGRSEFINE